MSVQKDSNFSTGASVMVREKEQKLVAILRHNGFSDVNECDQNLINCNKRTEYCLNTHGSAKCMPNICQKGYRMNKQKG